MKYSFKQNEKLSFFCKTCLNITKLKFDIDIIGDNSDSTTPKKVQVDLHSTDVKCGRCGNSMVAIDSRIVTYIKWFNKHGYKTRYCCSGHIVKESIDANLVGIKYNKDSDYRYYPFLTTGGLIQYAKDKSKNTLTLEEIRGMPQNVIYLDTPNLVFSSHMETEKKVILWDIISKMIDENGVFKTYPTFYASCDAIHVNGPKSCEPTYEDARIMINTVDDSETLEALVSKAGDEENFKLTLYQFIELIDDIIYDLNVKESKEK